jgi:iron complex transport system substrate-binding protein
MKKNSKSLLLLLLIISMAVTSLIGCSQEAEEPEPQAVEEETPEEIVEEEAEGSRVITDMVGVEVEIPDEVNTVINIWPSSNQIMILLGATDKQIAYFETLQSPNFTWMQIVNPDILEKPSVGANRTVTAEELLTHNPDLVITASKDDAESYRQAGIAAVTMMFNNFDGMKESIVKTADALGDDAPERAEKYIEYLDENIELVSERLADVKDEDKPTVYYLDGQQGKTPYLTSGNGTMQEEWITMAGGKLATDGLFSGMSQEITPEQLLTLDPDYILVGGLNQATAYEALMDDEALSGLTAIKEERVTRIPQGTFQWCRFGSEEALQVVWAAKTLYPERFDDIDMKEETISFYKKYLDYDLSEEYADAILAGKNTPDGK